MGTNTTPAREAIVWAAGENGWTEESHGITRVELKRGADTIVVRFTVKGAVHMAWNGEEEITGKGKRETVLALLEEPAPVVAPAISVEMPGGDTLDIPATVLEDEEGDNGVWESIEEDTGVTSLLVCTDCVMVLANGECTHDECRFPAEGFYPITGCPTVKGQAAVWGDQWSGLVLSGDEEDETIFSTAPCDGCGDTDHGDRHTAAHVEWLVTPVVVERPRTLRVRGPWNRGVKRHGARRVVSSHRSKRRAA